MSYAFKMNKFCSIDVKIFLSETPGRRLIWYLVWGSTFWLISGMRSAPWIKKKFTSGGHGTIRPLIFRLRFASPQEKKVKKHTNGLFLVTWGLPQVVPVDLPPLSKVGAKDEIFYILIYIAKANFWKIVAFKGMNIFKYSMVAVQIEGLRIPLICLFDTLFSWQCPFNWS
jgi:hypothetical protein